MAAPAWAQWRGQAVGLRQGCQGIAAEEDGLADMLCIMGLAICRDAKRTLRPDLRCGRKVAPLLHPPRLCKAL